MIPPGADNPEESFIAVAFCDHFKAIEESTLDQKLMSIKFFFLRYVSELIALDNTEWIVCLSGVGLLPVPLRSFFFHYSKRHFLQCSIRPKQFVRQNCCNSPEIYFYTMLIVHMTFINAFNAIYHICLNSLQFLVFMSGTSIKT